MERECPLNAALSLPPTLTPSTDVACIDKDMDKGKGQHKHNNKAVASAVACSLAKAGRMKVTRSSGVPPVGRKTPCATAAVAEPGEPAATATTRATGADERTTLTPANWMAGVGFDCLLTVQDGPFGCAWFGGTVLKKTGTWCVDFPFD